MALSIQERAVTMETSRMAMAVTAVVSRWRMPMPMVTVSVIPKTTVPMCPIPTKGIEMVMA
jgi:hypothetical protein